MIHRGDIYDAFLDEAGQHPTVVITREQAIPVLSSIVVVLITSNIRGHVAEVQLDESCGLSHISAANCDNILTVEKEQLTRYRGCLTPSQLFQLNNAVKIALGLETII